MQSLLDIFKFNPQYLTHLKQSEKTDLICFFQSRYGNNKHIKSSKFTQD